MEKIVIGNLESYKNVTSSQHILKFAKGQQ